MKPQTVGDRVREIRELRGVKQPEFAALMNAVAKRLKLEASYDNTMVSKMEVGRRDVGLDDAAVIAALDPKKRGRLWVGWGLTDAEPEDDTGLGGTASRSKKA